MMGCFAARCSERGIGQIYGYYYPTRKNGMVKDFYKEMGFEKISEDAVFNTVWSLDITKGYLKRNKFIIVDF